MHTEYTDLKEYFKQEEKFRNTHLKTGQTYTIKHPTGVFNVEITAIKERAKNNIVTWRRDYALFGSCTARDFIRMIVTPEA